MKRRGFLGFAASSTTCAMFPSIAQAADNNQQDYDMYRRQYTYKPVDYTKELNSNYRIENNILPFNEKQQEDFWAKPRRIFLNRKDTGEQSEIHYFKNGQLDQKQYWMASYLLRDVTQKKMVYMDPKLLDLICAVQAWLVYYGNDSPLSVTSGFRTQKTNSRLEGAARNSMHLYGKALDFRVAGLDIKSIASIADQFSAGGIGLYPSSDFLHLDTGGVRKWTSGKTKKS
ncbi:YcbK family protein [archaeon]|nr:YcbK family protein [archaeon]